MTTEEQSISPEVNADDIIEKYDEMFKNRYTEADPIYLATVSKPKPAPPCVRNWYNKPKRGFDWTRDGQQEGRGQRGGYWGHRGQRGHYRGYHQQQGYRGHSANQSDYRPSNRQQGYHGYQQGHRYQPY